MNTANRRQFFAQAAGLGCTAVAAVSPLVNTLGTADGSSAAAAQVSGKSLLPRMKWFNEPASAKQSGETFVVTTKAKTDFWRKTFYDFVTDNGHFFFLPVTGDFTLESRVAGKYTALYAQAGLMVRIDSGNWPKCGLELVDSIGHASVVVTRDFSDWSTVRGLPTKDPHLVAPGSQRLFA